MRTNQENQKRYFTILVITFFLGIVFMLIGFSSKKTVKYFYAENNSIDYNVYLKENNYFDSKYLEKNKTYITSLIDFIRADYSYNVNFNKPVSGKLNYQLIAKITANRENGEVGNYWTKEYALTEAKVDTIEKTKLHQINVSKDIFYNNYNDILQEFVTEYSLPADSTLKIFLMVTGEVKIDGTDKYLDIDSNISLSLPLSKLAIEGTIVTDDTNSQKEIVVDAPFSNAIHFIFKLLFFIDIVVLCRYIYLYNQCLVKNKKHMTYRKKIREISNNYEDIITNVKSVDMSNYTMIQVNEFNDLLNVYNNVREPINCKSDSNRTTYFLIDNNTCYMYVVSAEDFENNEKK